MNDEARLLMSIWESLDDFIATGDKQEAAEALIMSIVESGTDIELLYDADGECPYIDRALTAVQLAENEEMEEDNY